jgi:hypothetical protein
VARVPLQPFTPALGSADASSQVAYTRVPTVGLPGALSTHGRGREWWAQLVGALRVHPHKH